MYENLFQPRSQGMLSFDLRFRDNLALVSAVSTPRISGCKKIYAIIAYMNIIIRIRDSNELFLYERKKYLISIHDIFSLLIIFQNNINFESTNDIS